MDYCIKWLFKIVFFDTVTLLSNISIIYLYDMILISIFWFWSSWFFNMSKEFVFFKGMYLYFNSRIDFCDQWSRVKTFIYKYASFAILHELLKICSRYWVLYNIEYNAKKVKEERKQIFIYFFLVDEELKVVNKVRYLCQIIKSDVVYVIKTMTIICPS